MGQVSKPCFFFARFVRYDVIVELAGLTKRVNIKIDSQQLMNGQLSAQPLAELVREISFKGLSGTLRLQHEAVKAAIYFDAGRIIYAASNARELRLAEYLKKQGLVSEKKLTALGASRSDASLVSALCADGSIDRKTVDSLISRQVGDLLMVALLWTKGTWEFDDRSQLGDSVHVTLDTPGMLLQSARKMELAFVESQFPVADELISPVADLPDFDALLPSEGFVLSRAEHPTHLSDLIALSGLREPEARKTIYGLVLGGFLEREHRSNALKTGAAKAARPAVSPTVASKAPAESLSKKSQPSEQERLEDLEGFLTRLDSANNHYEVLNVSTTSSEDHIKGSYYALARNYHPDRFHLQAATPLHARIESAFARITQAYETLMDPRRRSGYDAKLTAQEKAKQFAQSAPKRATSSEQADKSVYENVARSGEGDLARAEISFKEGFVALQQGKTKVAVTNLAAAARAAPQDARYRAYYGRALATQEETRRLAETELQAAVKLDPSNSSYRVMLAELYYDLGFFRRAEAELERAVSADPNNADAQKLQRKLEAARATK